MKAIVIASTASMIDQFNIPNIEILQKLGYVVEVACNFHEGNTCDEKEILKLKEKLISMNVNFYDINFFRDVTKISENVVAYRQLKNIFRNNYYKIVHCQAPISGVLTRIVANKYRNRGAKVLYTAHGFHFYKGAQLKNWLLYFPIEWVMSFFTDVLITINKEDYIRAQKYMKAKKVEYVPGVGIDLSKFTGSLSNEQKHKKKMEIGIPSDAKVILSVGELNENKNQEIVIRALAKLKNNKLHYVIAGMGNLKIYLSKLSKELDVENNVHLIGFRNDIAELYKISDIFVHPSFREGLPVALMEAMASGLPCVVSRIRGNVDLIRNKKMLCNPNSIDDFARAIYELESSKFERKETGKQNRVNIHCCSVEKVVALITSIYEAALK